MVELLKDHAGSIIQLLVLIIAAAAVIIRQGSRLTVLENMFPKLERSVKENCNQVSAQRRTCNERMDKVVDSKVLDAKLETITNDIKHLNKGQNALFRKMDDVYRMLLKLNGGK